MSRTYSVSAEREIEDPDWDGEDESQNRGGTLRITAEAYEWQPTYSWSGGMPEEGGIEYSSEEEEWDGKPDKFDVLMWGEQHKEYLQKEYDACYDNLEED